MALIQMNILSKSLMRTVDVDVILPIDKIAFPGASAPKSGNFKTLYLLHGIFGSQHDWLSSTRIQRWAEDQNLAVVMPAGENMFYVDQPGSHAMYGEFIGKELPELMEKTFPLSHKREARYIAGLSMGGYGALRNGLKYADHFSRIGAFSAAANVVHADDWTNDAPIFFEGRDYAEAVFSDLSTLKDSDRNPLWSMKQLVNKKQPLPEIYMACGTKDPLYKPNIKLRDGFISCGANVTWDEAAYGHEWTFWDQEVEKFLQWLPLDEGDAGMNSGNVGL